MADEQLNRRELQTYCSYPESDTVNYKKTFMSKGYKEESKQNKK